MTASFVDAFNTVNTLKDQIAAITADDINNTISSVVQPYISNLTVLKEHQASNPLAQADIQAAIDDLTELINEGKQKHIAIISPRPSSLH